MQANPQPKRGDNGGNNNHHHVMDPDGSQPTLLPEDVPPNWVDEIDRKTQGHDKPVKVKPKRPIKDKP